MFTHLIPVDNDALRSSFFMKLDESAASETSPLMYIC